MNPRLLPRLLMAAVLLLPTPLLAQLRFQEGRDYVTVPTPATTGLAPGGKIEVVEVFSYICGGCNGVHPLVEQLRKSLPADAAFVFVHAGFNTHWPLFQRAHVTAQQLGIADRNHERMFTSIWDTGALPFLDQATHRIRQPLLTMADIARFYAAGGGTTEAAFIAKTTSPEVNAGVGRNEELIKGWQVPATPTFMVGGRYRINNDAVASVADLQALIAYLVGLERSRPKAAAAPAKQGS